MSSRYLMEPDEAHRQYERLIEVIASNNDLQGQAAALRTQFDTLLNLCVEAKLGSLPKDGKMNGFVVKINELFDTGWAKPGSLHKRLIELTSTFNNTSAHTYDQYKRLQKGKSVWLFTESTLTTCIATMADFIAYESGVPIPPQVQAAVKQLERVHIDRSCRNLDLIVLLQLYETAEQIAEGAAVVASLKKMVQLRSEIGISSVKLHLIAYAPPLLTLSPIVKPSDFATLPPPSSTFDAPLREALQLVNESLERWETLGGEKPWLVMLTRSLPATIDPALQQQLQQLIDTKMLRIYPMAMSSDTAAAEALKQRFEQLWPKCGPDTLSPRLSENFVTSLLEAMQRRLSSLSNSKTT